MNCKECKESKSSTDAIPYIAYEGALTRLDKQLKRLWVVLIICIVLLFASNGIWIAYMNQYDFIGTSIEAEQDGDGVNIVGAGDVDYGTESENRD